MHSIIWAGLCLGSCLLLQPDFANAQVTRCELQKPALCPDHPSINWMITNDDYEGSASNKDRCLKRAEDYHLWCGYVQGEFVSATFYSLGSIIGQTYYSGTRCELKKPAVCPDHPTVNWTVTNDNYQGSAGNKDRCLQRAGEYHQWCGYVQGESVSATFYNQGSITGQLYYSGSRCELRKPALCPDHPEYAWTMANDNYDGSARNKNRCLQRAQEWHQWCGYANNDIVSAAFYDNGALVDKISYTRPIQMTYFVSPVGDDANSGTMDAPFKTVEKARNVVRGVNKSMTGDIVVNIRKGIYYLNGSALFSTLDSGTNGFNVIYRSYDGIGSARFIGGQAIITTWNSYGNGIYYTDLVGETPFYTFFENGKRAYRARFPNRVFDQHFPTAQAPYLLTTSADISNRTTLPPKGKWVKFRTVDIGKLTISEIIGDQLRIHISNYGKADWGRIVPKVNSLEQESAYQGDIKLNLSIEANYAYGDGDITSEAAGAKNRFFFMDDLELLDSPGEFYLDKVKERLYYRPYENIFTSWMIFPKLERSFYIYGTSKDNLAQNIVFDGLSFEFGNTTVDDSSAWTENRALVYLNYTKNIKVNNCYFSNAKNGLMVVNSQFISVTNSLIRNMANNGVVLKETNDSILSNLKINNVGTLGLYAQGIGLFNSSRNQVSNCEISNSARYGITLRGNVKSQYDVNKLYSAESPSRDNIIKYLKIFNVNQDSGDTGALHSAAVNYAGDPNINRYEQISISNWDPNYTTHPSVEDPQKPDGIFFDWPDATMNQVLRYIHVVGFPGVEHQFRSHGTENKRSAWIENVSWVDGFNPQLMEYGKIGLAAGFPQEFMDSRLIARWSFEKFEVNGMIKQDIDQFDYSGMDAPVILYNSPGPMALAYPGVRGKGIRFDGIDDYTSSPFRINVNRDFTIMVWAKYEQQTSGGSIFRPIVYSGTDMGKNGMVITTYADDNQDRGKLGFRAGNFKVFDVSLSDGQWHMIALTRKNYEFSAYFDGALLGQWKYFDYINASELYLAGDVANNLRRFKGSLDELRIYNYAVPSQQISYFRDIDRVGGTLNLVRINARRSFGSIEDKTAFGSSPVAEVVQRENRDNQIWIKIDAGGGYFRLRNLMTGKYLQSQGINAPIVSMPYENTDNQLWTTLSSSVASYVYLLSKDSSSQVVELGGVSGGAMNKAAVSNSSFKHFVIENVSDVRY
ncbi:MAG: right-handed parallel beta-helix repeat-containing protein [Candidatus Omnitrophica bacterium]|nr:right-handed parallel beta-helix repeat-containing protein [Candidatus Omnitrophota bacterium]